MIFLERISQFQFIKRRQLSLYHMNEENCQNYPRFWSNFALILLMNFFCHVHKTLGLQEKFIPAIQMFVMLFISCSTKTSLSIFRPFYPISDNFWTLDKICEILFCNNIVQNFIAKIILFTESKNVKPFSSYVYFFEAVVLFSKRRT